MFTFLSPIIMWPCITACLAWYGVLNPSFFNTIVCSLRESKSFTFKFSTSSRVASPLTSPTLASDLMRTGSFSCLTSCLRASSDLAWCLTRDSSVCAFHSSLFVFNPKVPSVFSSSIFNS